jgi:hypothetical protein
MVLQKMLQMQDKNPSALVRKKRTVTKQVKKKGAVTNPKDEGVLRISRMK